MGNVASTVLMYALEAAWVFQRLIDQDYRQNHGGRLKPIASLKNEEEVTEVFLPNGASTPILSRSPHHHSKLVPSHHAIKHAPARLHSDRPTRHKKTQSEPFTMVRTPRHRRSTPCKETTEVTRTCLCSTSIDTMHWVTCHARTPSATLRRAFSDINLPRHPLNPNTLKLVVNRGYATDPNDDFAIRTII